MNRKENKAYKAMDKALKAMDKALDSAPANQRYEMFARFMGILSAAGTGKIYLDRVRCAAVQAERDHRNAKTTQTQEVYEW